MISGPRIHYGPKRISAPGWGQRLDLQELADFLGEILAQRSKAEIARGGRLMPSDLCVRAEMYTLIYCTYTPHAQEAVELRGGRFFASLLCF